MAVELGVAYVSVVPSARDFGSTLRKQLGDLSAKVAVSVDSSAVQSLRKQLTGLSTNVGVNVDGSSANSKLRSALGDQSSLGKSMGDSAGASMSSSLVSSATKALATIAATIGVSKAIKEGFDVAINFETTEVAFTGLLGSADAAQAKLKELQDFAKVTPFDFPTLSDAARKLLAFGTTAEDIVPTMQTLGDAAAALGVRSRDVDLVVRALGQITSKGRVQLEELIQIAENFPGSNPIPALAASVNASVPDFVKALSQPGGALEAFGLTGEQAVKVILDSFKQIKGASGAMERQSLTLSGALSTLKDQLRITAIESLKPFLPGISKAIRLTIVPNIEKAGNKIRDFARELDGVGKPTENRFAIMGDAVGRFAKRAAGSFKEFRSELDGVGKPVEGTFAQLGDSVGRFINLLKPLPKAFADAFETGDVTSDKGLFGLAERAGEILRDLVDGAKTFAKAFEDGASDAQKSGFLGFMSDLGDYSRDVVEWLKVKIPAAIDALNGAIDKIKPKFDGFFQFFRDHETTILTIVGGLATFVVTLKELQKLTTVAKIVADIVGPILALGPIGIIAAGVAALAGAFIVAYEKSAPFHEAIDTIVATFKEGGFAAGLKEIGDKLGDLFGGIGDLWDKWKPKLEEFFRKAKKYIETGIADLFGFEIVPPPVEIDLPIETPVPDAMQQLEIPPGLELSAPPRQFETFGEGLGDAIMNHVIPGIAKWIEENEPKIFDAFNKMLDAIDRWMTKTGIPWATKEGYKFGKAFSAGVGKALLEIGKSLVVGTAKGADKTDQGSLKGVEEDFKRADRASKTYLDNLGRDTVSALDMIGHFSVSALDAVGHFTVDAGGQIGGAFASIPGILGNILDQIGRGVAAGAVNLWQAVADDLSNLGIDGGAIASAFGNVVSWLVRNGAHLIAEGAKGLWKAITDDLSNLGIDGGEIAKAFGNIVTWLTNTAPTAIANAATGMWNGLVNAFIDAINAMIHVWNKLEFTLPEVDTKLFGKVGGWTLGGGHIDDIPHIGDNAKGNVFRNEFTGLMRFAETARARPEIISPVSLMAETFRRELAQAPGNGRGVLIEGGINITEAQSAAAVVDEIHARLGWMLTTRAER